MNIVIQMDSTNPAEASIVIGRPFERPIYVYFKLNQQNAEWMALYNAAIGQLEELIQFSDLADALLPRSLDTSSQP